MSKIVFSTEEKLDMSLSDVIRKSKSPGKKTTLSKGNRKTSGKPNRSTKPGAPIRKKTQQTQLKLQSKRTKTYQKNKTGPILKAPKQRRTSTDNGTHKSLPSITINVSNDGNNNGKSVKRKRTSSQKNSTEKNGQFRVTANLGQSPKQKKTTPKKPKASPSTSSTNEGGLSLSQRFGALKSGNKQNKKQEVKIEE
eukprot:TRINITY_DN2482_c0_g1_i2.p1 TRINITY_DN2482_c0_g1~~TRINITY_DN2482_c0_g1_i2.p1  ORF type:complete len:226 (-),score=27.12 TRINITY_DN2482_c0_g1_i2:144-728(-)